MADGDLEQGEGAGPSSEPRRSFVFKDERQKHIHRLLMRIGPGPAAFYRDACNLMDDPDDLGAVSHIIGHLFREIESALCAVLQPLAKTVPQTLKRKKGSSCEKVGHKNKILGILAALDIPVENPVARVWIDMANPEAGLGLHRSAHRDNLNAPRLVTPDTQEYWNNFMKFYS